MIAYAIAMLIEDYRHSHLIATNENFYFSLPVDLVNVATMIYIFVNFRRTLNHIIAEGLKLKESYVTLVFWVYLSSCILALILGAAETI